MAVKSTIIPDAPVHRVVSLQFEAEASVEESSDADASG